MYICLHVVPKLPWNWEVDLVIWLPVVNGAFTFMLYRSTVSSTCKPTLLCVVFMDIKRDISNKISAVDPRASFSINAVVSSWKLMLNNDRKSQYDKYLFSPFAAIFDWSRTSICYFIVWHSSLDHMKNNLLSLSFTFIHLHSLGYENGFCCVFSSYFYLRIALL